MKSGGNDSHDCLICLKVYLKSETKGIPDEITYPLESEIWPKKNITLALSDRLHIIGGSPVGRCLKDLAQCKASQWCECNLFSDQTIH